MRNGFDSRLNQGWWVLRVGLGVGPFLAGLDKYFNLLTNWPTYLSPLALRIAVQRTNLHAHRRRH